MAAPPVDSFSIQSGMTGSQSLDTITSTTTFDLFSESFDSSENSGAAMLPRLPSYAVGKKRDRDEYLASSSDAPLFSSDDLPSSSSENYLQHRNKLQHRRRWYEAEDNGNVVTKRSPVRIPRPRGPFKRTADSAVWLGSDDSSDNEDVDWDKAKHNRLNVMEKSESTDWDDDGLDIGDENFELENTHIPEDDKRLKLMEKALQTIEDPGDSEGPVFPYFQKQPDHLQGFHFFQEQAREIVTSCIDLGGECVDLSTLYLSQIRTSTLRPLRYHTKTILKQGRENGYQELTPALRLYLSNNLLEDVPGEVFHLKNIQVLSLRSNHLTEILPSISELTNLRELNLGSNQLSWLPWELLSLLQGSLRKCMVYPNPFIRPVPSTWNYGSFTGEKPIQVASTQIAFLDITGASRRNWPPGPSSVPHYWPEASVADEVLGPRREDRTKTPSLIELALRACYKSPQLSQLPFLVPKDCPTHLTQLLKDTWKLREAGGKICSVCGREYIIPRTEWLEWWYCIPSEAIMTGDSISFQMDRKPVPLLRRGCSWACWDQNGSPLIRGWSSAVMPGGREAELEVQN